MEMMDVEVSAGDGASVDRHDLNLILSGEGRDFLVRNNGEQVKISSLVGKIVGLYFSASWCGPCHRFTPKLADAYSELSTQNADFEVVFVSADEDDESFHKYFSAMPWLAIPFSDSTTRTMLDELFTVQGIPHLVVLDKNGIVVNDEGDQAVREYGAEAYPFTKERIAKIKADEEAAKKNQTLQSVLVSSSRNFLVSNSGNKVPVSELEGKIVGLYFSLSSYGSCRKFTPKLVEMYTKLKENGEAFEVVLISLDDDESSFQQAFAGMPWLAIPFKDKSGDRLARYFELETIPTLVVIGADGKTLISNAAELVEDHGLDAYPFSSEKLDELAEKEKARLEAQTLESLLVSGDIDYVIGKGGAKVPVSELVGKTILLSFSAHWCPPCRAFLPKLIEAYTEIAGQWSFRGGRIMEQAVSMLSHSSLTPPLVFGLNPRKRRDLSVINCSKTLDKPQSPTSWRPAIGHAKRDAIAQIKASDDLDAALSSADRILNVQDMNFILRHFGESRKWREVSQVFDWMLRNEICNFASYSSFIKYMGISHNPIKALQVYDSIVDKSMKVNVSVCNSILGCLVRNGRFESSIKLFDQMKDGGLTPDLVTYSSILAGCTKVTDGYSKAMQLVNELKDNGLQIDSVIYGNLLAICASNNLCEEAEIFFQQMKNEGYTPNLFHYSSLLNAYSEDGNYEKAELLIKDMKYVGLAPNKVILTTLLKVYSKGGLFEKSKELLAELESLGYAEDEMPYCLLMDNLAKTGHIHEAKSVFAEMKEKGVKSDGYSYSILISALCRNGLLQEARQLAKDFEANYAKYDLVMLNTLLRVYCNAGDMDSAMHIMRKMDELKISPDWNTFHILIKYFCRERLYHLAYQTAEDMHRKGHQLDEELCTSLILQLGRAGSPSEALSVYNMLRYSKRRLCKSLHEKVLDILIAAGLLKEAYVVMKDNAELLPLHTLEKFAISFMKSGNINLINDVLKAFHRSRGTIDAEVFRIAISRYVAKPEKKDLLLQLLQWMSGQGYVVDSSSRNLLLRKSHLFGEKHLIAEILSKQNMMSRKLMKGDLQRLP